MQQQSTHCIKNIPIIVNSLKFKNYCTQDLHCRFRNIKILIINLL